MGISEVLLCSHRYLKDIMVNSKNSKFNSVLLPVPDNSASQSYLSFCDAQCISSLFLPARRYASAGNSDRNVSVRPSVCHAPVLCQNEES